MLTIECALKLVETLHPRFAFAWVLEELKSTLERLERRGVCDHLCSKEES